MNRRPFLRVLASLLAIFAIGLVAEVGARHMIPAHKKFHPATKSEDSDQRGIFEFHAKLGWLPRPGFDRWVDFPAARIRVISNSEGFRDHEWPTEERAPQWALLGDSQVWGYNVQADQRFSDRLASAYPEIRFRNYGVSGYGTGQEYLLYLEYVRHRRLDGVILLFGDNDRANNTRRITRAGYARPQFDVEGSRLLLEESAVPDLNPSLVKIPWYRSHLWDAVRYRATRRLARLTRQDPTHLILSEFRSAVAHDGADFLVVIESEDASLRELCERLGVPVLELGQMLTAARRENQVEFSAEDGRHWTPFGHQKVAEAIAAFAEPRLRGSTAP